MAMPAAAAAAAAAETAAAAAEEEARSLGGSFQMAEGDGMLRAWIVRGGMAATLNKWTASPDPSLTWFCEA